MRLRECLGLELVNVNEVDGPTIPILTVNKASMPTGTGSVTTDKSEVVKQEKPQSIS